MSSTLDLPAIHAFAIKLAKEAGALILSSSSSRAAQTASTAVELKKNRVDLVTATDQAVEKFIKDEIAKTFPDHSFIGEESFAGGEVVALTDKP